jgi:hypothetical protein
VKLNKAALERRKDREQHSSDARAFYIAKGLINPSSKPKRKVTVKMSGGGIKTKTF